MSKTIILGDTHIGAGSSIGKQGIGSHLNSRTIDQFNILNWVRDQAVEYNVSSIIITGDIFDDPKPSPYMISLFIDWLKSCVGCNISIHMLVGNHDLLRSGQHQVSSLDIISSAEIENVFVYNRISTIDMQGISFTLLPFRDRRSFDTNSNADAINRLQNQIIYEAAGIDRNNIKVAVGHFSIEGSIPALNEIDDKLNELFCPISMFKDYDYTFCGHVHRFQVLSQNPLVSHIGSMDISSFGEADQKKFIVIIDPKSSPVYKYLEIPTRPLNQISISVPNEIKNTTEYVVQNLKDNNSNLAKSIVRLNISLEGSDMINVDRSIVEKCLNDLGAFHVARINEERKIAAIKAIATADGISNTVNETTAIKMYADANINENMKNDFIALAAQIVKESA